MLFDLDNGSETGTPDWTACDYLEFDLITGTSVSDVYFYFDYLTISKSNYIGFNGIGTRKMVIA